MLFHLNIQVKKTNIDALFDLGSQMKLIVAELVNIFGLEFHDNQSPYPLGWVNRNVEIKLAKYAKLYLLSVLILLMK